MSKSHKIIRVEDVVHQNYIMLDGLTKVEDAIVEMRSKNVEILIIQKRHDDDEYGIVLMVDIAKKVLAAGRSPDRVNLYEIMTKPVLSVNANMNIKYCASLFNKFGLAKAPVIDNQQNIIGMVNYSSLVLNSVDVES